MRDLVTAVNGLSVLFNAILSPKMGSFPSGLITMLNLQVYNTTLIMNIPCLEDRNREELQISSEALTQSIAQIGRSLFPCCIFMKFESCGQSAMWDLQDGSGSNVMEDGGILLGRFFYTPRLALVSHDWFW
jgi:hypothetical protein